MTASSKLSVVILISGTGSNMRRIAELAASGDLPIIIKAVVSDKASAKGLHTAAAMSIPTAVLDPKTFADRAQFDMALAKLVASFEPQLVLLAGFMRILTGNFIAPFKDKLLNIHPSLLPKHRGLHTHQRALEAGDTEHGASVHIVTEELDAGPIIIQARVPVLPEDDEQRLAARVLSQEHLIYPEAVRLFATGRLVCNDCKLWLDGKKLRAPLQVTAT